MRQPDGIKFSAIQVLELFCLHTLRSMDLCSHFPPQLELKDFASVYIFLKEEIGLFSECKQLLLVCLFVWLF